MDGFVWFLLGALVSIPISILSPFVTQRISQFVARRNEKQARIRNDHLQRELEQIKELYLDHNKFVGYMVERILVITLMATLGTLIGSLFYFSAGVLAVLDLIGTEKVSGLPYSLGGFVNITIASIAIRIGLRALRVRSRVLKFEAYHQSIQKQIEEIG